MIFCLMFSVKEARTVIELGGRRNTYSGVVRLPTRTVVRTPMRTVVRTSTANYV
jgi:hypothetical protein